jgi:integrase
MALQQQPSSEIYRNFVLSIRADKTRRDYIKALSYFMQYLQVNTYDELIKPDPKKIQANIIDFIIFLKDTRRLAPCSIVAYLAAIRHFYDMNEIDNLKWKKINRFKGESYPVVEDRPYTREEIKKLLDVTDLRNRAIILLMCSSGVRIPFL